MLRLRQPLLVAALAALSLSIVACRPRTEPPTGGDGGVVATEEGPNNPGSCSDNVDNDNDTFVDCDDFQCATDAACELTGGYTIYELQDEAEALHPAVESEVSVAGVIVTAVRTLGDGAGGTIWNAFVSEPEGGQFSGIEVIGMLSEVKVGDALQISGIYKEFFGFSQIAATDTKVLSSGNALPSPEIVSAGDIATAGTLGEAYEGVLVQIQDVTVTEASVLGSDNRDHGDFRVTGGLIVGPKFRHDYQGVRTQGDQFQSITGVLDFSYNEFRLQPRVNSDLVFLDGTSPGPAVMTVQAIQNPDHAEHPAEFTSVELKGVIVTAISPNVSGRVNFFVQDPAGGPWSGLYVYNAPRIPADTLKVGDVVDVAGQYKEFSFNGDNDTVTELQLSRFTFVEVGQAPTPAAVPAAELATKATGEQWEGVLVEVVDATVSAPRNQYGEFTVEGGLKVDDMLYPSIASPNVGDVFSKIVGVHHYNFGYALLPRGAEDLAVGTTVPTPVHTIFEIQDAGHANHPATGARVEVKDVVVTALDEPDSRGRVHFFVQESAGGPFSGIYVYNTSGVDMSGIAVGDQVSLVGSYTEFAFNGDTDTVSELVLESLTRVGAGVLPDPVVVAPADLAVNASGEQWEGVLVTATNLTVTVATDQFGVFKVTGDLGVGNLLWSGLPVAAVGDTFTSVTGVHHYNFGYTLLPRSAADLVP